jgi:precorrin-4/cobalt-precorrin-4 C11-methyltransferase
MSDPQTARQRADDSRVDEYSMRNVRENSTTDEVQEGIPFIGAGPGDPGLLTVTGRELVQNADLVVHAGSLVNSALLDTYADEAETVSSIGKDLEELVPLMGDAYTNGDSVVRLHSGDPSIYGAALEQMDALEREGVPTYFVPGVTAAFAASATLRTQLTLNDVANHVVFTRPQGTTLSEKEDHISEFVGMGDVTTCLYLGTHAVSETMDRLLEDGHDPDTSVVVVYHASWPDEDIIRGTLATISDRLEAAGYRASALVIIGEVCSGTDYERSYLYGDWANRGPNGQAKSESEVEPESEVENDQS